MCVCIEDDLPATEVEWKREEQAMKNDKTHILIITSSFLRRFSEVDLLSSGSRTRDDVGGVESSELICINVCQFARFSKKGKSVNIERKRVFRGTVWSMMSRRE